MAWNTSREPIVGSAALAAGTLTRGVLRARYTSVLPNIYLPNGAEPTVLERAKAAWQWSGQRGIIAGRSALDLYIADWQVTPEPIELIARNSKYPAGVIVRNERISVDEITVRHGLPVTTPVRTALDLARHLDRDDAVALLDPFTAAAEVSRDDIWQLAERYRGTRSISTALDTVLDIESRATTPEQTRVRLLLRDSGLRPTHFQIRIFDGWDDSVVAMGWSDLKVAVDCDLTDAHCGYIIRTTEFLQSMGWLYIPVLPQHTDRAVCRRTGTAVRSRLRRRPTVPVR